MTDPNGYDNESIGSGETEEVGSSSSFAGEARLFSANTDSNYTMVRRYVVFSL